jgi:hypothetical protein
VTWLLFSIAERKQYAVLFSLLSIDSASLIEVSFCLLLQVVQQHIAEKELERERFERKNASVPVVRQPSGLYRPYGSQLYTSMDAQRAKEKELLELKKKIRFASLALSFTFTVMLLSFLCLPQ